MTSPDLTSMNVLRFSGCEPTFSANKKNKKKRGRTSPQGGVTHQGRVTLKKQAEERDLYAEVAELKQDVKKLEDKTGGSGDVVSPDDLYPSKETSRLTRWMASKLHPGDRDYESMPYWEIIARSWYEENAHPNFTKHEKRMNLAFGFSLLGAIYASYYPALTGYATTVDNMTPDVLRTSGHVLSLNEEQIKALQEGKQPFEAGETLLVNLPDGSTLNVHVKDTGNQPGTPTKLVMSSRTDGRSSGHEDIEVEMTLDMDEVLGLQGQSAILTDDGDPATILAHFIERDHETDASREHAQRDLGKKIKFLLRDQKPNWIWFFSGAAGLTGLIASWVNEAHGNRTPAEQEWEKRSAHRRKAMDKARAKYNNPSKVRLIYRSLVRGRKNQADKTLTKNQ